MQKTALKGLLDLNEEERKAEAAAKEAARRTLHLTPPLRHGYRRASMSCNRLKPEVTQKDWWPCGRRCQGPQLTGAEEETQAGVAPAADGQPRSPS